jgi:aryl-alcohol dehydrogenase-like predicted oxidoreductase
MTKGPARLGFGTAGFIAGYGIAGGSTAPEARLLERAVAEGVDYFDTAQAYGAAEHALARMSKLLRSRSVRVCTKVVVEHQNADGLVDAVRLSRERLGLPLHAVLVHNATHAELHSGSIAEAMTRVTAGGLAGRTGASTYGIEDAADALRTPWCGVVQVEYSILNQSVITAIRPLARGQEIVVRSVLCKGLLTPKWRHVQGLDRDAASAIERVERASVEWGLPMPELAIRFALDTSGADIVLVGIATDEELDVALRASRRPALDRQQIEELRGLDRPASAASHPERWSTAGIS